MVNYSDLVDFFVAYDFSCIFSHGLMELVDSDSCLILECAVSVYDGYVEFFFDIWVLEIANIILFDVTSTDLGLSHLMNLGYNNFMVTTDGVFVARPVESVSIWC